MFDVISKADLFAWVAAGAPFDPSLGLKAIQDAFILSELKGKAGQRLLEVGGGNSRVLTALAKTNECWNFDSFDGRDGGPPKVQRLQGVKAVVGRMGDYSQDLPAGYFDWVFSISVMEHVPAPDLGRVFDDCARVLKPGGAMLHAIDAYVLDSLKADHPHNKSVRRRFEAYKSSAAAAGFVLAQPDRVLRHPYFSSSYASNPNSTMMVWNRVAPQLTTLREIAQSVSLKAIWQKPEVAKKPE